MAELTASSYRAAMTRMNRPFSFGRSDSLADRYADKLLAVAMWFLFALATVLIAIYFCAGW